MLCMQALLTLQTCAVLECNAKVKHMHRELAFCDTISLHRHLQMLLAIALYLPLLCSCHVASNVCFRRSSLPTSELIIMSQKV